MTKACARCLWRSGSDRLTQRKKSHAGAPWSNTPPFDHNQKSCPSHAKPQGKPLRNVRLGSLQATSKLKKKVFGTRMRKSRTPAGFVPKPLRNCSRKNPETSLLEPTKNKEIVPKPCETAARKMPKRCFCKEKKLPQARQTFAQRKTWKPASHQAKLKKKVFGTRMRKSRTPAGFVPKPLRNCSRKNPETSLLEPTKNKEIVPKPCETAARKMPKRCFWNLLKTKKKSCLKQGKPLRNVRLESPQATRQNP